MSGGKQRREKWFAETREQIVGDAGLAYGGSETWFLLHELRPAYLNGLYLSTVLLCAAIVEQMLFSVLVGRAICDRDAKMTLGQIIETVEEHNLLSNQEVAKVRKLKQHRTAIYHYRDLDHEDSPVTRQVESIADFSRQEDLRALEKAQKKVAESSIVTVFKIGMEGYENREWYYYQDGRGLSVNRLGDPFELDQL